MFDIESPGGPVPSPTASNVVGPRRSYEHLDMLMRDIKRQRYPRIKEADMPKFIRRYRRSKNPAIKTKVATPIILGHIGIAVHCAIQYARLGTSVADLLNDAVFGLIDALDRYEPSQGPFTTIATWRVRHAVQRAFQNRRHIVRLPIHLQTFRTTVTRTADALTNKLGRAPLPTEVVAALQERGGPWKRVKEAEVLAKSLVSSTRVALQDPAPKSRGLRTIEETLPAATPSPEEAAHLRRARGFLEEILNTWDASENAKERLQALVIRRRFGLDGMKPEGHGRIGNRLGLERTHVRDIEARAVKEILRQSAESGFVDNAQLRELAAHIHKIGNECVL